MIVDHDPNNVTRRRFMGATAALGAVPLLPHTAHAQAPEPKRGGRLRLGLASGGPSDTLDPAKLIDAWQQNISYQTRNSLVELLPSLQVGPDLAESWEPSADAKTWVFNLRKGVTFHNGKTFGADDAIFSINYHRGTTSGGAGFVANIEDIKADGQSRFIVKLKVADADFPAVLTEYRLMVMPDGETNPGSGMGTGAYVLQTFEAGVRGFTKRNPNYHRSDRAFFDEVETLCINETNARTNALLSGQVDVINRVDLKTVKLLANNPALSIQNVPGLKQWNICMLTQTPPFDNNDVRLALKYAIDRKQILEKILNGYGVVGNDNPITPNHRFFDANIPQRMPDPDKARFHIRKAGIENQPLEMAAAELGFDGAVDAAVLFQSDASKAGINIKLNRLPIDGYFANIWRKRFCTSFRSSRATEDLTFTLIFSEKSSSNDTQFKNAHFESLLQSARGELDEKKRRTTYSEMQRFIWEEGGLIVPIWINHIAATTSKVKTPAKISGAFEMDAHRNAERWWFG
ncbi:ABC transporter substrate-binding protein [Pseudorhodoplanes sp.]|uniref:ABC transporter substrate-binding protein n=1 Tax=Pseudorhodoplanes sp. TaxID=1934341 RepID=UPI003D10B102